MIGRVVAALGIALGAFLALTTPAHAADGQVRLDPSAVATTARLAEPADPIDRAQGCDGIGAFLRDVAFTPPHDVDGWTFTLPADAKGEFAEIRLTFLTPERTTVDVTIPGSGRGWLGHLGSTGSRSSKSAYLVTTADWTLTDGDATVSDEAARGTFLLGTTCARLPPTTGAAAGTAPDPVAVDPSPPPATGDPDAGSTTTAVAVGSVLLVGVGLIAAAVALVGQRRRDGDDGGNTNDRHPKSPIGPFAHLR